MRYNDKVNGMQNVTGDCSKSISIMYELESSRTTGADAYSGGAATFIR